MDIENYREFLLAKRGVTEEMPFGPDTLVYKVMGKMFALVPLDEQEFRVSLKNKPEKNAELRAEFPAIQGAFHMNKTHWNMLIMNQGLSWNLLLELSNESYDLVVKGLSKKLQTELANL